MGDSIEGVVQETVQEVILDPATSVEILGTVTSSGFLETPELAHLKSHFPGVLSFVPGPDFFQDLLLSHYQIDL